MPIVLDPTLHTGITLLLVPALILFVIAAYRERPQTLVWIAVALCIPALLAGLAGTPLQLSLLPKTSAWILTTLILFALGIVGGNPLSRALLGRTMPADVRETPGGGILVLPREKTLSASPRHAPPQDAEAPRELLRGGRLIGYLERFTVILTIAAGFPEGIAFLIALKGIGRFSELSQAAARERFLIGSLASLGWASAIAFLVAQATAH